MNKIEYGMKLDFSNVLIRPKRSTINSRSEVSLDRTFQIQIFAFTNGPVFQLFRQIWILREPFEMFHVTLKKYKIVTAITQVL